jgi:hypothetical protein
VTRAAALVRAISIAAVLLPARVHAGGGDDAVPVRWGKQSFTTATVPERLPAEAKQALQDWEGWAREHDYRFDFGEGTRIVLVSPKSSSKTEAQLALIGEAEKWFDQRLPAPDRKPLGIEPRATSSQAPEKRAPAAGAIPEDPESAPPAVVQPKPGAQPKSKDAAAKPSSWGAGAIAPDTQTGVVLALETEADGTSAAAWIAKKVPALRSWSTSLGKEVGFVIGLPLVAACIQNAAGQEEWDPDHELLSRVVRLLTLRRFGEPPLWILYGIAWEAEIDHDGMVYVFPYRDEFVYTAEHGAWPIELKNAFKDREKKPVELSEFATLQRGKYEGVKAQTAWGMVRFLSRQKPAKFSAMLEELRQFRDANDRKDVGHGKWERQAGYEFPLADQQRMLVKYFGADVLKDAPPAFRKVGDEPKKAAEAAKSTAPGG